MPTDYQKSHTHSTSNKVEIGKSQTCACFCCLKTYPSEKVSEWADDDSAICPHCGVDSVIGDASGLELSPEFLEGMNLYWFRSTRMPPSRITFTGLDTVGDLTTTVEAIKPWLRPRDVPKSDWTLPEIEFGVLYMAEKMGKPRYPDEDTLTAIAREAVHLCVPIALHLCGEASKPNAWFDMTTHSPSKKSCWSRIQVTYIEGLSAEEVVALARWGQSGGVDVILQRSLAPLEAIPWFPGLTVLADNSRGKGATPENWPAPSNLYALEDMIVYAGGLGPDNIVTEWGRISQARGHLGVYGIDMESGIRTDNRMDPSKVRAVLEQLYGLADDPTWARVASNASFAARQSRT